jgi:chemotaxis signal transduction protein
MGMGRQPRPQSYPLVFRIAVESLHISHLCYNTDMMSSHEEFIRSISHRIEEAKQRPAQESQHRYIIVLLGGVRYAIPMNAVLEIVRTPALTPIPGARAYIQGIFFHRGAVIPVIDIPKRFQSGDISLRVPEHIIIVEENHAYYGFLVDHVVDALDCHPKDLLPLEGEEKGHLPSPYLVGRWKHSVTTKETPFRYDFLIAGPGIRDKYQEDAGERTAEISTFLLSTRHMVEALENDGLETVLQ